jgi:sigma-E factor negative regulatory protein RseA
MNEERDSQLSAMFDGELPAGECELLARRLAKDDVLRTQWARYALIGAAVRAERGVRLDFKVADRVATALASDSDAEASVTKIAVGADVAAPATRSRRGGWLKPMAGVGIAASVAAASILWIRTEGQPVEQVASATAPAASTTLVESQPATANVVTTDVPAAASATLTSTGEPASYVVPPVNDGPSAVAPAALANYVVAHSEFSGPLSRRLMLSGLVANEAVPAETTPTEVAPAAAGARTDAGR